MSVLLNMSVRAMGDLIGTINALGEVIQNKFETSQNQWNLAILTSTSLNLMSTWTNDGTLSSLTTRGGPHSLAK